QHLPDRVAGSDRPRPPDIEHAAFRRADADRGERPRVVRHLGRHQTFYAERSVGEAVGVHDVYAVRRRRPGALLIDVAGGVGNGQSGIEHERLVVAVHRHAVAIGALWQRTDAAERRLARGFDDGVAEPVEIGDLELVHHLDQPAAALVVAGRCGVDVAFDLQWLRPVGRHPGPQVVVHVA